MNKKQNNRNKWPLLLAALLTLSLIVYGSFAYFTDSSEETAGLELTLGNVEITSKAENWHYVIGEANPIAFNDNLTVEGNTLNFSGDVNYDLGPHDVTTVTNARPGDKFTRKITFTEIGSLDTVVKIDNQISTGTVGPFSINVEQNTTATENASGNNDKIYLKPGESVEFDLTVKVVSIGPQKAGAENGYNQSDGTINLNRYISDWAGKTITVEAFQENASESFQPGSDE